jgi:hypothetical protein
MKAAFVVITGAITIIFGTIFQFQGRGIVGPESSFMYYNKDWITYGIGIITVGAALCGVGVLFYIRTRLRARL